VPKHPPLIPECAAELQPRVEFLSNHPHIPSMATWQKTFTREPPKTKAELREMLTQAVQNTQPAKKPEASDDYA
jgi:hypothetical protein